MPTKTVIPHPLVRDGKSQGERLDLGALVPETLALDDRSEQQLLAYLYEYAKSVAFHDLDGTIGNWQDFFRAGVAIQAAIISQYNPDTWQQQFNNFLRDFDDGLSRSNLSPVLDFLFETAIRIDGWQNALANDTALVDGKLVLNENDLRQTIRNYIVSNLGSALEQLIAVANVWADKPTSSRQPNYDLPDLSSLDPNLWKLTQSALSARNMPLQKLLSHPQDFEKAAGQKLNDIFQVFLKAIGEITLAANTGNPTPFTETHDPHLGLLYAFLRLFKHVRDTLNGMTRKHLDFYYRDVLALKTKAHKPDTAHVIFELNKPAGPHLLDAGALVKNGKDANGVEIHFNLENEIVVSKAQIQSLRTVYRDHKLYAAPVANSADGRGGAFQDPGRAGWPTMGQPDDQLPARTGLMIASPALRLEEGVRKIEISLFKSPGNPLNFHDMIDSVTYKRHAATDLFFANNGLDITKLKSKEYSGTRSAVENTIRHEVGIEDAYLFADLLDSFDKTYDFITFVSYKPGESTFKLLKENNLDVQLLTQLIYTGLEEDVKNQLIGELKLTDLDAAIKNQILDSFEHPGIFSIEFTGKKGWFKPRAYPLFKDNKIAVELSAKEGPIVDADAKLLKADYGILEPLIRLVLNPDIEFNGRGLYGYFKDISIGGVELAISARGLQNVIVNTEEGPADPKKAFLPFGPVPVPQKRFWVDHHSFYETNFIKCSVIFEWDQLPLEGFTKHYELYTANGGAINDAYFTTEVKFGQAQPVPPANVNDPVPNYHPLFNNYQNANNSLNPDYYFQKFTYPHAKAKNPSPLEPAPINDPILFTLRQEFFHRMYPELLAQQLLIGGTPPNLPLPPYTPIIKSVTLEYESAVSGSNVTLFHLHPFEESNFQKINLNSPLLPRFNFDGALLIGLSEVNAGSTLDLLFQFDESSADAYLEQANPEWYYLGDNDWKILAKGTNVIHDDTKGFIRSGIVQLALPFDLDLKPTILPPDLCWLKVTATKGAANGGTAAVCRAIAVHAQAAKTVFQAEAASDLSRLNKPLAAGSISKLVEPNANIKAIQQPYSSFGGRAPEDDAAFYARVSEQLRHKGRAVSLFDYEQLILEAFPDIYKVKCITHTLAPRAGGAKQSSFIDQQAAAGHVTIVVVPRLAHLPVADRFQPRASRGQLAAIAEFLLPRISPFVQMRVMNPSFDKINTAFGVKFKTGKSPEFYKKQLGQDIEQFLSPWAFSADAKIAFGGTVFQSSILGFIEERDYVDYVQDFVMETNQDIALPPSGQIIPSQNIAGQITPSTARAILVSGEHKITIL